MFSFPLFSVLQVIEGGKITQSAISVPGSHGLTGTTTCDADSSWYSICCSGYVPRRHDRAWSITLGKRGIRLPMHLQWQPGSILPDKIRDSQLFVLLHSYQNRISAIYKKFKARHFNLYNVVCMLYSNVLPPTCCCFSILIPEYNDIP